MFVEFSQDSQENTCASVSFLIKKTFFNKTPLVVTSEQPISIAPGNVRKPEFGYRNRTLA